ncbi:hypothetical protein [Paenibacillus sp. 481]|uniref:hypothetical protein n=1 Tax=Paenibacillus sp. 481 TaxID=2835869 RepID=UPI001E4A91B9|nr:hypothetical protein [Paenibacillus sp. 481]UHA72544.1 hypothetical protein KIK04_18045 [Paenibacillus sp. 481]
MVSNYNNQEQERRVSTDWFVNILPLLSASLGGAALWYTWFMYGTLAQADVPWYNWIRPAFLLLCGILCLVSTALFVLGKSSAWSVFKGGLFMIPMMLMSGLIMLVIRAIQHVIQGSAQPFLVQMFTDPKNLIIPIIVMAFVILGSLSKRERAHNHNNT